MFIQFHQHLSARILQRKHLTEILALVRPQKTPALQAKALIVILTHVMSYCTQDGLKGYFYHSEVFVLLVVLGNMRSRLPSSANLLRRLASSLRQEP